MMVGWSARSGKLQDLGELDHGCSKYKKVRKAGTESEIQISV